MRAAALRLMVLAHDHTAVDDALAVLGFRYEEHVPLVVGGGAVSLPSREQGASWAASPGLDQPEQRDEDSRSLSSLVEKLIVEYL
jgi:hypothetical protein